MNRLQAEFNAYKDSVVDGTLVPQGVSLRDELNDTKAKLQGALAQVRDLSAIRRDLLKDIRVVNEDCEEMRRQLQSQIDDVKLVNEKIRAENQNLIKRNQKN